MSRAADLAKQLFSGIKETAQAIAPGLKDMGPEIAAEGKRLASQGASELAHALFSGGGSAYVPYGPHQQPAKENEQQRENEGMSR